ncbi:TetR family transcriptional regulator [Umezawaea tangerina]|uniref:TetR family transcriptional regulator n=2 Tax=Umezawaea tangerina TaxID=84725 RepID=A0A2T0T7Y2_9PSEU|nr:TetR family transcriptional regulator [Umezawaea tangerina]
MAAAIAEIADRGYADASLTRIAERAGISKGLLWHYFAGRDDLMRSTVVATVATIRDRVAAELDLTRPVPEVIRAALHHVADLRTTHRAELVALDHIVHNLRHPDGTRQVTLDFYEETYRGQEALFRRGQEEGSLRDFDTRVMAVTYQGAVDVMLAFLDNTPGVDAHAYADKLADILLLGISATR